MALALADKTASGRSGTTDNRTVAEGDGWRVVDVVCTSGPGDRPFEERLAWASVSLVLSGVFVYRSDHGSSLMSSGSLLLGNPGQPFECSHEHGEGDRCLSLQFEPELFAQVARDAGLSSARFDRDQLPPLRALAPLTARVEQALGGEGSFEEIALALAGAVLQTAGPRSRNRPAASARDRARIAGVLSKIESRIDEAHPLEGLAREAGLSRYHFLRTFKSVTGTTPHQWLVRARLREAAQSLASTPSSVTDVALDVGFEDLSNFVRSFRAEFGVSPGRYRGYSSGSSYVGTPSITAARAERPSNPIAVRHSSRPTPDALDLGECSASSICSPPAPPASTASSGRSGARRSHRARGSITRGAG